MDDFGKRDWLVIRTRPRWEKKVYNQIVKGNINAFLPLITTIKKWSDRKKKVEIPMFNSYIFVNVNKLERQQAIQGTLGAMNYIFYNGRPARVSEQEINSIKISLRSPEKVRIENNLVMKGDYVEITSGPFMGMNGIITEIRGNYKLTVNLYELSMSLNIVINPNEIKKIEKPDEQ
ncbi:MAG: UpxY family transcription antiterminator [Ignavibacteriaceae bacterium]|nr:MAG: UpxY family transcription antiterminator [Chlorobiota bacterium]MBV6398211.1 Transcription antitermination protein RfaH [Ignavibacteria bacterium]MCC6885875.1 UpxY family transcription antiterminator [Ignavibacteriales bacterium]MCE7953467.1 UpxY family transcription antiterminator [Chlorobi bacterium CHB7]MDL1887403.1 UpxY family transcription antiterminator [Ignavibacteria bacterium CHB1]MEB2330034.1 UpxY family transcription antiterminator [Ignavibacteriaceae bacterium]RIK48667.1 M